MSNIFLRQSITQAEARYAEYNRSANLNQLAGDFQASWSKVSERHRDLLAPITYFQLPTKLVQNKL